ncbi:MAG: aldo/keto reductase [Corynebacterium sp.]|nr:aldo/keto reductase [Corynebacterium sp.]
MSIVGTGSFFGSPEEERDKLMQALMAKKKETTNPVTIPEVILNDGNTIPQLGFGVFKVDPEETERVVSEALAAGYRHIDTAAFYGNEEGVGRAIAQSGIPRDELYVTTKLWPSRFDDAEVAFTESLNKLGLDYVDLFLLHWPAPKNNNFVTAWKELEQLGQRSRSIGVCNFLPEHLAKLIDQATIVPAINQFELHPALQQRETQEASRAAGIAVESWGPLGQGRYDLSKEAPIMAAAENHGKTPAQVVLRWHLQHDVIVFPKTVNPERMRENINVFDFELTTEEMLAIDGLERGARGGSHPDDIN